MDVQELLDIAMRHATAMSDAMIVACFQRAHEMGKVLRVPTRPENTKPTRMAHTPGTTSRLALDAGEYERMVRDNSDTRRNHC